ncbi:MAG: hypothetical protein AB7F91_01310 [Parvularculaceae bacterium]
MAQRIGRNMAPPALAVHQGRSPPQKPDVASCESRKTVKLSRKNSNFRLLAPLGEHCEDVA